MSFRLTIARAMALFGLITAAGLAAVVFTGIYALSDVKVGGPHCILSSVGGPAPSRDAGISPGAGAGAPWVEARAGRSPASSRRRPDGR